MIPESQRELFQFLSDPATFGVKEVERIDTHISAVFLAGERAYKLKRAVRLPFLDFTSLEARRTACAQEVALNRRAAPELYQGMATVTREADGRLALGGEGPVLDWLVVMHRFRQEDLLSQIAAAGKLDRDLAHALAEAIARFHALAEKRPHQGGAAGLRWTIDNNHASIQPHLPGVFRAGLVARLLEASREALERLTPLLEHRRADGHVRLCHGDLHLGNICLFAGRPMLFDCIEFSNDIACIDVMYDLAFLLMDLDKRGMRAIANLVFNRYVDVTGDVGALAALPLFLAQRAWIRAHVEATIAAGEQGDARATRHDAARDYLDRAHDYLDPPPPRLAAVGGFSGSGKSRLGRDLAPLLGAAPGALVLRSDVIRKRLAEVDLHERLEAQGYSHEMTERTYATLYEHAEQALAAGHSVVADAVFAKAEQRQAIEAVARRLGVPFQGYWLEAPFEVMAERITSRKKNVSDATVDVLRAQLSYDLGPMDWMRIDSSGSKAETLARARSALQP